VGAQIGIVVALAREVAVQTPLTERLVELIHDVEKGSDRSRGKRWSCSRPATSVESDSVECYAGRYQRAVCIRPPVMLGTAPPDGHLRARS
jgi:hypothetical protein